MLCWRGTRLRWARTRFRGRTEQPGHQLGKLRAFAGRSRADLGERPARALVGLGCFHRDSPLFRSIWCACGARRLRPVSALSLLSSAALHQCGDPRLVRLTVELRQEIVRAQLVEITPPSAASVVPDPVAARHTPGDVASSAHRLIAPRTARSVVQPCPRRRPYGGWECPREAICGSWPTRFPTVLVGGWGASRGVHLGSRTARILAAPGFWSRLNGRERG